MKGYKGFNPGMVCRGKQYAENTVFEEEDAVICESGMHFCQNPFDVLDYYGLVRDDGSLNEVAEVETIEDPKTDDGKKYCTRKLKIGAKLSFSGFIKACIDFMFENTINNMPNSYVDSRDSAKIGSSGDSAQIGSSGDSAQIGSSGDSAKICSSGDYAQIGSSGNCAQIGSSGNSAKICSSGNSAKIGSSGNCAKIGSSGYSANICSSGDYAQIGSSGNYAKIGSSGNSAQIGSSGDYAKIGSSGNSANIGSSGNCAWIDCSGDDSVICCAGINSAVKAKHGCWITLSEWEYDIEKERYVPFCVKTEFVDGKRIKADTWYKLKDGEFVEVE